VENICWIRMQRNNRIVEEPGVLFNKTKLTLLMFRKVRRLPPRERPTFTNHPTNA